MCYAPMLLRRACAILDDRFIEVLERIFCPSIHIGEAPTITVTCQHDVSRFTSDKSAAQNTKNAILQI